MCLNIFKSIIPSYHDFSLHFSLKVSGFVDSCMPKKTTMVLYRCYAEIMGVCFLLPCLLVAL